VIPPPPAGFRYPHLKIAVVNTDTSEAPPTIDSTWSELIANQKDYRLELSDFVQQASSVQDYGYKASDYIMKAFLSTPDKCDYIMFTNGDNYYRPGLLEAAAPLMKQKAAVVGFNFLAPMKHQVGVAVNTVKQCEYAHGQIDLGSVMFNADELRKSGATFENNRMPCPGPAEKLAEQQCRAIDSREYFLADWGLVRKVVLGSGHKTPMLCIPDGVAYLITN
jgi:hypothetical protein